MKTETYHTMEYSELDELVNDYFPKSKFEFVADEEMNNYTDKSFGNISKEDLKNWYDYDKREWNDIILGKIPPTFHTRLFLQYFVANDILPEGNYLIKVSW